MLATENPQLGFVTRTAACRGVRLRISCPGQPEQVVELPNGKTTIGSSPRCHVRIQQPGVHPVHCLIFSDEQGLTVRRWATNALLNGVPFDETALNVGDVLSVGSVDLEVVDATLGNTHQDPEHASVSYSDPLDSDLTLSAEVRSLVERTGEDASRGDGRWPTEQRGSNAPLTDGVRRPNGVPSASVQSEVPRPVNSATDQNRERLSPSDISFVANVEQVLARLRCGCAVARTRSRKLLATLRRDRDSQCRLMEQVAATEEQFQTAASAREAVAAELNRTELQLANAQRCERELELLSSEHQKLVATHGQLVGAKAELESHIQRLAAEQAASAETQQTLAAESVALAAESRRLAEENARLLAGTAKLTGECATLADERERVQEANARLKTDFARLAQEKDVVASQNELLSSDNQALLKERERVQETNARLQADVAQLAKEKDVVASQNGLLSSDKQALLKEHERLRQENTQAWDKISWLTADNNNLANLRSSLADERDQFRTEIDRFRAEVAALTAAKQALEDENQDLANERDRLAQENAFVHDALEQLTQGNVELGRERSALADERDRLRQEFAQAGNEVARLNQEKALLVAENAAITAEQERLRQENSHVWDKVVRLSEENTALAESGPALSQELVQFCQDNDRLRDDVARLSGEVTRLTDEHGAAVEGCDQFRRENNRLREELALVINETNGVREESAELRDVYEQLRAENDRQRGNIFQMRDGLAKLTGEKAAQIEEHKALADALSEERRLRETLEKRQEEHCIALAGQEDVVNALRRQLDDSRRDLAEAGKTIARFEADLSDKQREVADATATIESLEQLLVTQTHELSKAASALEGLEQQLRDERPRAASAWTAPVTAEPRSATEEVAAPLSALSIWKQDAVNGESPRLESAQGSSIAAPAPWESCVPVKEVENAASSWADAESNATVNQFDLNQYASAATPCATQDDEESIEQYMAKMMQRIRGDGPHVAASQVASVATSSSTEAPPTKPAGTSLPQAVQVNEVWPEQAAIQVPTPNLEELMRKGPILESSIDLEAFRALANQSARRAIGIHATRKHRREAVTKIIASTLASMTSVWLMLNAPAWRDLHFITGCVLLLIAAYWAGQAYGALLETVRAGDYDRSEEEAEIALEPLHARLPIDVEHEER